MSSFNQLVKAAKKSRSDFADGTVIRWTSSDRYQYAAIKTPLGWYSTAREGNPFVGKVLTWDDVIEIVSRAETSNVEVSLDWSPVIN